VELFLPLLAVTYQSLVMITMVRKKVGYNRNVVDIVLEILSQPCSRLLPSIYLANALFLVCTTDSCDPSSGCSHVSISCNDNDACTIDSCDAIQGCLHVSVNCDDKNACTTDSCDSVNGCSHILKSNIDNRADIHRSNCGVR
jgi:hypothetical protein